MRDALNRNDEAISTPETFWVLLVTSGTVTVEEGTARRSIWWRVMRRRSTVGGRCRDESRAGHICRRTTGPQVPDIVTCAAYNPRSRRRHGDADEDVSSDANTGCDEHASRDTNRDTFPNCN